MNHVRQTPRGGRVLVVDDEADIRTLVSESLARQGYEVVQRSEGRSAMETIRSMRFDLVVLDLGLPGLHGLDLLAAVRQTSTVPVVILSGRAEEGDRVLGLEMGADDYLPKPFSSRELVARVESVLRRSQPPPADRRVEFPGLALDPVTRDVEVRGQVVELTAKEFDLLLKLASSPRQVYSRPQLLREVWGSSSDWQQEATITEHVRRVRQKIELDPDQPHWIRTVRGVGYRFEPTGHEA